VRLENVAFVSEETAEAIHDQAISDSGGTLGIINRGGLLSAIEAPKATYDGAPLYASLAEMAAVYVWGIVRNHPFTDGNKRTALLIAITFLATNGRPITVDETWVDLMVRVASEPGFQRDELVRAFASRMAQDVPVE